MSEFAQRQCKPCEGGVEPMDKAQAENALGELANAWSLADDAQSITGEFEFKNYYQTQAFVNAVAWIAHCQDHHPDITFGYKNCSIMFTTHAIGGLSDNDFICAARVDQLQQ